MCNGCLDFCDVDWYGAFFCIKCLGYDYEWQGEENESVDGKNNHQLVNQLDKVAHQKKRKLNSDDEESEEEMKMPAKSSRKLKKKKTESEDDQSVASGETALHKECIIGNIEEVKKRQKKLDPDQPMTSRHSELLQQQLDECVCIFIFLTLNSLLI